jgi:hypothetical protein
LIATRIAIINKLVFEIVNGCWQAINIKIAAFFRVTKFNVAMI